VDESVIHSYLHSLLSARNFSRIVQHVREPILTDAYVPSNGVIVMVARAAGEQRDSELSKKCLQLLLGGQQRRVRVVESMARTSFHEEEAPPSRHEAYQCLAALAKCTVNNFREIMDTIAENEDLRPSPEDLLTLELYYLRRAFSPWIAIDRLLLRLESKELGELADLSIINKGLLITVLQVMEHDRCLEFYRIFSNSLDHDPLSDEYRRLWLRSVISWAVHRGPNLLSFDDRTFIAREIERYQMLADANAENDTTRGSASVILAMHTIERLKHADTSSERPSTTDNRLTWPDEDSSMRFIRNYRTLYILSSSPKNVTPPVTTRMVLEGPEDIETTPAALAEYFICRQVENLQHSSGADYPWRATYSLNKRHRMLQACCCCYFLGGRRTKILDVKDSKWGRNSQKRKGERVMTRVPWRHIASLQH
jgi:hypothetical protein